VLLDACLVASDSRSLVGPVFREFTQKPLYLGADVGAGCAAPGTIVYHGSKKGQLWYQLYKCTDVTTSSVRKFRRNQSRRTRQRVFSLQNHIMGIRSTRVDTTTPDQRIRVASDAPPMSSDMADTLVASFTDVY
jgi:hypothetical protein